MPSFKGEVTYFHQGSWRFVSQGNQINLGIVPLGATLFRQMTKKVYYFIMFLLWTVHFVAPLFRHLDLGSSGPRPS